MALLAAQWRVLAAGRQLPSGRQRWAGRGVDCSTAAHPDAVASPAGCLQALKFHPGAVHGRSTSLPSSSVSRAELSAQRMSKQQCTVCCCRIVLYYSCRLCHLWPELPACECCRCTAHTRLQLRSVLAMPGWLPCKRATCPLLSAPHHRRRAS